MTSGYWSTTCWPSWTPASARQVSVIGQSMGGWTALGLALRVPDRVRALVLADTVAGINDETIAANESRVLGTPRSSGATPCRWANIQG